MERTAGAAQTGTQARLKNRLLPTLATSVILVGTELNSEPRERCKHPRGSEQRKDKLSVPTPSLPQQLSLIEPVEIPLTKGYVALIDPIDADLASHKWHTSSSGSSPQKKYARRRNGYKSQVIHRVILSRMLGRPLLETEDVDHINGDGLDNRRCNLRLATRANNCQNRKRAKNNKSGFKGVCWAARAQKWIAYINANGEHRHLGFFATAEEAYAARVEAAYQLHGEFARLD